MPQKMRSGNYSDDREEERNHMKPLEPFSLPVILCPACGHGIDPHGTDPGGMCGVGHQRTFHVEEANPCPCFWSPNDIAATLMMERDRIIKQLIIDLEDAHLEIRYLQGEAPEDGLK